MTTASRSSSSSSNSSTASTIDTNSFIAVTSANAITTSTAHTTNRDTDPTANLSSPNPTTPPLPTTATTVPVGTVPSCTLTADTGNLPAHPPPFELPPGTSSPSWSREDLQLGARHTTRDKEYDLHTVVISTSRLFADTDTQQTSSNNSSLADTFAYLHNRCKVLVIGAGGLGCEVLKGLALSGFRDIHLVDMDCVDTTNLNRQFLFSDEDVGQPKAEVAAKVINSRLGRLGVHVTPHHAKIQQLGTGFYSQFNIIIGGLDSVSARRWINSLLHDMVEYDKDTGAPILSTIKPLLDGGTEGLKGQSRVIIPTMTSCFDCSLETIPAQVSYPLCTIAETPRLPEHCIEYAMLVSWPQMRPAENMNPDDPHHIQWIKETAQQRADAFGIGEISTSLTSGVVTRVVPAVASTNAIIAASLVQEALKLATYMGPVLNNYLMYMGLSGIYTYTFEFGKNESCLVCSGKTVEVSRSPDCTLRKLIDSLCEDPEMRLKSPSISTSTTILYMQNPPQLRAAHEHKLSMTLAELVASGAIDQSEPLLFVTDPNVTCKLNLRLRLTPSGMVSA